MAIAGMLGFGLLLRIVLVFAAEHQLDADEATVGVMALDILEGRTLPFFFYHQAYNGGAAFEAYLAAAIFAITGPSAIALKLSMCGWWLAAAGTFADLARRALSARQCALAVLFFCVGTPFLLEWSVKARGGYAETLLFSVLLLWIASPARGGSARASVQGVCFGVAAGLGLWASEMLLPMLPCAAAWLIASRTKHERAQATSWLAAGFAVGLIPLLLYNLGHDWAHLEQSALLGLATGQGSASGNATGPLSMRQLYGSFSFVLGPVSWLLGLGIAVGAWRVARARPFGLPHVLLAHMALYTLAYWLAGTRFLPGIAPSRVLYAAGPGIAVLLAVAVAWRTEDASWRRALAMSSVAIWLVASLAGAASWAASGVPRETGSWRGSWSLVDGPGLYGALTSRGIETAIVSYWTSWPLEFAKRCARARQPDAAPLRVTMSPVLDPDARAPAFVLLPGTPLFARVEQRLLRRGVPFFRSDWKNFAILSGFDASALRKGLGLPVLLDRGAWKAPPEELDGFN